ncbi:50S ribosomal protein L11 methyltransferase [Daejeonella sp.]|uniref:50S ribosomal protein L11 methyltransferase n=1 Tax=Daejeonella sp. TaxID=2805397 RepID=UPI00273109D7|nr:50S ribosomal protein L11 methyltransferase [Daejeonella sp.]MDP2413440.1 50S ribosomal protein L11 methyltransferase [Daejeonella sp.]
MTYIELVFTLQSQEEFHKDLMINALSEIGFDTFEDTDQGFKAYIPESELDQAKLDSLAEDFTDMFSFTYTLNKIPHQNWNEVWESNFEPIQVAGKCYIRATFHEAHPEFEHEIVIDPKMAFGTGHHQTTALMMEFMLEEEFHDKKVLDMGCGTGILAILASKLGVKEVLAIDYDEICYESTIENSELNKIRNIKALKGSKEVIPYLKFDIILANINRNILIDQLETYARTSKPGTLLFLSGFYEDPDLEILKEKCKSLGFSYLQHKELNNWVAAKFRFKA